MIDKTTAKKPTPTVRRALAGITLVGALTLPLGGVASASGGGDRRAPSTETKEREIEKKSTASTTSIERERSGKTEKSEKGEKGGRSAATPEGLKASCTEQIAKRLAALDKLAARVAAPTTVVTPAHQARIGEIIASTKTGLTALQAELDASTTVDALMPLCRRVVTDFRVFALVVPQINAAVAADAIVAKQATFTTLRAKLVAAIETGGTPETQAELTALLASFDDHVAAVGTAVDGVADAALAVTIADYDANPKVLQPSLESLRTARKEAKAAARDAHHILELLAGDEDEDEHEHDGPVPTTTAPLGTTTTTTTP